MQNFVHLPTANETLNCLHLRNSGLTHHITRTEYCAATWAAKKVLLRKRRQRPEHPSRQNRSRQSSVQKTCHCCDRLDSKQQNVFFRQQLITHSGHTDTGADMLRPLLLQHCWTAEAPILVSSPNHLMSVAGPKVWAVIN